MKGLHFDVQETLLCVTSSSLVDTISGQQDYISFSQAKPRCALARAWGCTSRGRQRLREHLPGQNNLHHVPLLLDCPAQRGDYIAQAAHLADGRHLHRHVHHMQPWGLQLQHSSRGGGSKLQSVQVLFPLSRSFHRHMQHMQPRGLQLHHSSSQASGLRSRQVFFPLSQRFHRHMHHMQPRGLQLQHRSSQASGHQSVPILNSPHDLPSHPHC